jgi:hypothetical protein
MLVGLRWEANAVENGYGIQHSLLLPMATICLGSSWVLLDMAIASSGP